MQGNIVHINRSASLIAAMLSIPMASAQSVQAQASDSTLRFEVVSVKLTPPSINTVAGQLRTIDPGRLHYVNISLRDLVLDAYNLKAYQVVGPDWLREIALDIDATMRPGVTKEQIRVMFQNLLADRFGLTVHWDTRQLPAYSIVIAGPGPKMKESVAVPPLGNTTGNGAPPPSLSGPGKLDADGFPIVPGPQRDGVGTVMINGRSRLRGQQATIQDLASELSRQLKYPVTDQTGLESKYDFTVKFATPGWSGKLEDIPELGIRASAYEAMQPLPDLAAALQSQMGLKLQSKKARVAVLIVDHVAKAPTAN